MTAASPDEGRVKGQGKLKARQLVGRHSHGSLKLVPYQCHANLFKIKN